MFKRLASKKQRLFVMIGLCLLISDIVAGTGRASDAPMVPSPEIASPVTTENDSGPIPVSIQRDENGYRLYRAGHPYFIKGIGGRQYLTMAAESGANSVRTWASHDAGGILDRADRQQMTVMLGIWLSHKRSDYLDGAYRKRKVDEVQRLLNNHKNHPALLIWALGNEINLQGANTPEAWQFVEQLARLIKSQDPYHPVISVVAFDHLSVANIAVHAPSLDAVGINAYGALSDVRKMIDSTAYNGPYIITEWGVDGHWEARRTVWGRPIEPTSAEKVRYHIDRYRENILDNRDRCIGSYVFLWGQKQERTPTWYSMFIENLPGGEMLAASCPTVDAMHFNWSGHWPANQAPAVASMTVNDKVAGGDVRLNPGEAFVARVAASDPDDDGLRYVWQIMEEPSELSIGGAHEPLPGVLGDVVDGHFPEFMFNAPNKSGEYRLFVYVLDQNGHVGTANFPFAVNIPSSLKADTNPPVPENNTSIPPS
ncbi:glycoside hydrolase family 2 TIM barrel-domain containing protein [Desulfosarcina ovata]|uniref:Glycoside hydrolase family 2 catalytic domain-containing protein n=1 Tax=Desulfosarcina ovata subsp. ovata TaxID=2752305 RepID=A0A5K8A6A0_9BACT|nr:glycoside hydrolase family 2 TIM barrel-domain containing protein [Desulfosarcina ovata]BBO87918.1 hypothetical protein DSCOOX_10980 [Desulfosarcina ovata subsp. ovata]